MEGDEGREREMTEPKKPSEEKHQTETEQDENERRGSRGQQYTCERDASERVDTDEKWRRDGKQKVHDTTSLAK